MFPLAVTMEKIRHTSFKKQTDGVHVCGHTCEGQGTTWGNWFPTFTTWVPGIELRLWRLVAGTTLKSPRVGLWIIFDRNGFLTLSHSCYLIFRSKPSVCWFNGGLWHYLLAGSSGCFLGFLWSDTMCRQIIYSFRLSQDNSSEGSVA